MSADQRVQLDIATSEKVEECARRRGVSPSQVLREALEGYLAAHAAAEPKEPSISNSSLADLADAVAASVPDTEWSRLPADLARNFEHHRYGYPRED